MSNFSLKRCLLIIGLGFSVAGFAGELMLFSNKPVAMLFAAAAGQTQTSQQVIFPVDRNMHDYQLTVSDLKKIQQADVVVWLGPKAEPQLARLKKRFTDKKWISLLDREHAWLSWQGQQQMLASLVEQGLIASSTSVSEQLLLLKASYSEEFSAFKSEKFLMGHEAFMAYFSELGLKEGAVYSVGHNHGHHEMGEKERIAVQRLLAESMIRCVIEEPDLDFDVLKKRFPELKSIKLEPMAGSFDFSPSAFVKYNRFNLEQLLGCFKSN